MSEKIHQIYRMLNPYFKYCKKLPLQPRTILYESFFAESISCGPYALFCELVRHEDIYGSFRHVWAVTDEEKAKQWRVSLPPQLEISFVVFKSDAYQKCLATAGYLVNNVNFPQYFRKRKGQVYINTWHGIPLKKMGYDMPQGEVGAANTVRNFLQADFLLSPNGHHTAMYQEAYKLKHIFPGQILEMGQARTDTLFYADKTQILKRMEKEGMRLSEGKSIILYAPTWRGSSFELPEFAVEEYEKFYQTVTAGIDTGKYQLLIKPHVAVYRKMKKMGIKNMDYIVPCFLDTNEILSVTDVLISDYSSIFYDFIVTGRPVFFYCTDVSQYAKDRGIEELESSLPGPVTGSLSTLCGWLRDPKAAIAEKEEQYAKIRDWACPHDDGAVSARILHYIFKKEDSDGVIKSDKKKTLLFFLGVLRPHGITYSCLSLLRQLDYETYDVTLYIYEPKNEEEWARLSQIPAQVRVMVHTIAALGGLMEHMRFASALVGDTKRHPAILRQIGQSEYARCFGGARFDTIIDYVGYSPLFAMMTAYAPSGRRLIWQHNDLAADRIKRVNGRQINKRRLDAVFAVYPEFDGVVGCSREVMEVNKKQIGRSGHYLFVRNAIDTKRIADGLKAGTDFKKEEGCTYFVNIGRMSVEKNQAALVRAFARLKKEYSRCKLVIIGEGAMRGEIEQTIADAHVQGDVILTGNLLNPFAVLKQCDCFVLPSLHEGQPVVLLEARTLRLPIIVSDFSTVHDSLLESGQLLIGMSEDEIYKGLKAYMEGNVPVCDFDADAYNEQVMQELERVLDGHK